MILATEDINDMLKNRSDLFTHLNGMNREAAQVLQKMIKSRSKEKFTAHHVQILLTTWNKISSTDWETKYITCNLSDW